MHAAEEEDRSVWFQSPSNSHYSDVFPFSQVPMGVMNSGIWKSWLTRTSKKKMIHLYQTRNWNVPIIWSIQSLYFLCEGIKAQSGDNTHLMLAKARAKVNWNTADFNQKGYKHCLRPLRNKWQSQHLNSGHCVIQSRLLAQCPTHHPSLPLKYTEKSVT